MSWFRVDDQLPDHRKVRQLKKDRLPAVGLWTLAGAWASGPANTGGFVPTEVLVERWDPRERMAARLVEVGLWEPDEEEGEPGYRFHDWPDYQPSKADEDKKRSDATVRQQRARGRKRAGTAERSSDGSFAAEATGHAPVTRDVTRDTPTSSHVTSRDVSPSPRPCTSFGSTTRPDPARPPRASAVVREAPPSGLAERAVATFVPAGIARRDRQQLARHCDEVVADGATWTAVEHALIAWSHRSDAGPGLLPKLVTDAVKVEHGAVPGRRVLASTTDSRVQAGLDLADQLRAEQALADYQPPPQLRAIGGTA